MAETKIEWADFTFNPWMGCTKVSPACAHCYAERDQKVKWGPSGTRVLTSDANWKKPLKWDREAADRQAWHSTYSSSDPQRPKVFCASLADVFEDWQGPIHDNRGAVVYRNRFCDEWFTRLEREPSIDDHHITMSDVRQRLFDLIDATPNLDWLLLTKRPENIPKMWPNALCDYRVCQAVQGVEPKVYCPHDSCDIDDGIRQSPRKNVWLGTSVENQEYADRRIPELLKCRDLSPVLFLSCEPLLGPVDLCYPGSLYPYGPDYCCSGFECGCHGLPCDPPAYLNKAFGGVDWVIAGGESGSDARPSHPDWFRSIRDQCQAANVPFLFKQWGEWVPQRAARHSDLSCDATRQVILRPDGQVTAGFLEYGVDAYIMDRVGKKAAGRVLDGITHDGFPVEE